MYSDWFLPIFMKEIPHIMLVLTNASINNGMFSQHPHNYNCCFHTAKIWRMQLSFFIGEMSRHDIHENEKNSVSWCTVSKRTQDRPWRVSDESCMVSYCYVTSMFQVEASKLLSSVNCNLEARNNPEEQIRRANNYFYCGSSEKTVVGMLKILKILPSEIHAPSPHVQ